MTPDDASVPTTGAQFDAMLGQGLDEALAPESTGDQPETPQGAEETVDTGTEDTLPESIETGNEAEQPDDDSPEIVADVLALVDSDDKQALKTRIADMGKGIEKLKARDAQNAGSVQWINQTFDNAVKGDQEAIKALDEAFTFRGTSLTDFAIQHLSTQLGIDPADFNDYFPNSQVPAKQANQPDPKVAQLEQKLAAIEAKTQTQEWANRYGAPMAEYVEKTLGLKFDVATLAEARSQFPAKASADDIVKAVMKTNPDAYLKAKANEASPDRPPNNAYVSKGGKSAPKLDPAVILNDPLAFERLMKS